VIYDGETVGRIYRMSSSTGRARRALAVLVSDPAWYSGRIQRLTGDRHA
jgi:hypothetical protein